MCTQQPSYVMQSPTEGIDLQGGGCQARIGFMAVPLPADPSLFRPPSEVCDRGHLKRPVASPFSAVDAVYFLEIQTWKGTTNMTIEDLIAILMDIIPDAQLGEDEDG